jgi:hypothetical protein
MYKANLDSDGEEKKLNKLVREKSMGTAKPSFRQTVNKC